MSLIQPVTPYRLTRLGAPLSNRWTLASTLVLTSLLTGCAQQEIKPQTEVVQPIQANEQATGQSLMPPDKQAGDLSVGSPVQTAEVTTPEQLAILGNTLPQTAPKLAGFQSQGRLPRLPQTQPVDAAQVQGVRQVLLNYEQAPLAEVISQLADVLQLNVVIDPQVQGRVSLSTASELDSRSLWPLLNYLLAQQGVTMTQVGDFYHVKPATSKEAVLTQGRRQLETQQAGQVTHLVPLQYVSVTKVQEALAPLLTQAQVKTQGLADANVFVLQGQGEQVRRYLPLVELLDTDPFRTRSLQFYPLQSAQAGAVVDELTQVFTALTGGQQSYQFVALERLNAIFVVAPPANSLREVERWLKILDTDISQDRRQVYHYRVRHVKAADLAATLQQLYSGVVQARANTTASAPVPNAQAQNTATPSGALFNGELDIVADAVTNSLLVQANQQDFERLKVILRRLDALPQEVMINVMIAEVTLDNGKEFGLEWALNRGDIQVSNELGLAGLRDAGKLFGLVGKRDFSNLTVVLNAMQEDQMIQVLSSPSVLVRDNESARIEVGSEVPIISRQLTSSTASDSSNLTNEVQYKPTGVILEVTPNIDEDGLINLEIKQEVSKAQRNTTGGVDSPVITKRLVETKVLVRDGDSVVLGGIMDQNRDQTNTGVPFLKDLPLIGHLFKNQKETYTKTELLVILSPRLVSLEEEGSQLIPEFLQKMRQIDRLLSEQ
ncbi:general secretion pathway protein D [Allopseudospirillum japonicum]|uniref:General secretion pathway protein D n=1 Tax=Allopseudospirillum japonicum TaxID=64971 RepID=A0A1H6R6H5_9GAMM|nr:type II secretion system secretin GspD [Allopseudospirillum japonicum]SEI46772.1 general secretion pathway protein D [Allopseudospirillum japonicum]